MSMIRIEQAMAAIELNVVPRATGAATSTGAGGLRRRSQKAMSSELSDMGASALDETSGAMATGAAQTGSYHGPWNGLKASTTGAVPWSVWQSASGNSCRGQRDVNVALAAPSGSRQGCGSWPCRS